MAEIESGPAPLNLDAMTCIVLLVRDLESLKVVLTSERQGNRIWPPIVCFHGLL